MINIRITIEYDGKDFNGWQKQPTKLNIQGEIERATVSYTHLVGSSLAMYHALKGLKKNVDIIIPEYAKCFNELPGIDEVIKESDKVYDLAISLDAATDKLLNVWVKYFREADQRIVIDHHSTNTMFGDINYVDLSAPACAQVVYMLIKHYRWKITPEIGTCIMAGIITDTGGFQYSGAVSYTHLAPKNELLDTLFISDNTRKVVGTVELRDVLINDNDTILADISSKNFISVEPEVDQEEVAAMFRQYDLTAVSYTHLDVYKRQGLDI